MKKMIIKSFELIWLYKFIYILGWTIIHTRTIQFSYPCASGKSERIDLENVDGGVFFPERRSVRRDTKRQ